MKPPASRTSALWTEIPLLLAVMFVGTDFVASKYALEGFRPLALVAVRFAMAGLLLCAVAAILEPEGRLRRRDFLPMAGLGVVGVTLNQGLYIGGLSLTTGSDAALAFATSPVWGLILGAALGFERASKGAVAGVLIALFGVGLVVYEGLGSPEASAVGDLLVLGGAACWSLYAVLSLPLLSRYPPLSVAAYSVLLGGLATVVVAAPQLVGTDWSAVGFGAWAGAAYSTVLSSAFAFAAWQKGVSRMGAGRVLAYLYLVTLVGVLSSVLLLGDDLGSLKLFGGVAIVVGVYLARRR